MGLFFAPAPSIATAAQFINHPWSEPLRLQLHCAQFVVDGAIACCSLHRTCCRSEFTQQCDKRASPTAQTSGKPLQSKRS